MTPTAIRRLVEHLNGMCEIAPTLVCGAPSEADLGAFVEQCNGVIVALGSTHDGSGEPDEERRMGPSALPLPQPQHAAACHALAGELSALEASHAHLVGLQRGMQQVLTDRELQLRHLRDEAERDEAEILRLRAASFAPPHTLLDEAEVARSRSVVAIESLRESYGNLSAHRDLVEAEWEAAATAAALAAPFDCSSSSSSSAAAAATAEGSSWRRTPSVPDTALTRSRH